MPVMLQMEPDIRNDTRCIGKVAISVPVMVSPLGVVTGPGIMSVRKTV